MSAEQGGGEGPMFPSAHQDPTARTIETLEREVASLQETFDSQLSGQVALATERFASVRREFEMMEKQRVEQKADTKAAVDSALTAQKEAVKEQTIASERAIAKSEAATTKQLEQLNATFTASLKGVTDLLNETKDRVAKVESVKQGANEQRTEKRADTSQLIAMASIAAAIFGAALSAILVKAFGG